MASTSAARSIPSALMLSISVLVFALAGLISALALFSEYPELAVGITYDLALTAPFFYYLAIRKTNIPRFTIGIVSGLGIFSAFYLVPTDQLGHLNFIVYRILPFAEIAVLGVIAVKAWRIVRSTRQKKRKTGDIHLALQDACTDFLGPPLLARAVAFEASVIYHAVTLKRAPVPTSSSFTYHKKGGTVPLYSVLGFLIIAETAVFHILISEWSILAAWIITISSFYVLVLLIAQFKAARLRPIEISADTLKIRCGLFCDAELILSDIESAEFAQTSLSKEVHIASFLKGFENQNVLLTLHRDHVVSGGYGLKQTIRKIAFFADEAERLVELLRNHDS